MNRCNIRFSLLALLSLSTTANAQSHGYYAGVQIGTADSHVSSSSSSVVPGDASAAVSAGSGTSVSSGGFVGTINNTAMTSISTGAFSGSVDDKAFIGRIFLGYQLYDQLAFELGLFSLKDQTSSYTSNSTVTTTGTVSPGSSPATVVFSQVTGKDNISETALDLNVKGIWPITNVFNIYAKLGIAYMKVTNKETATVQNPVSTVVDGVSIAPGALSYAVNTSNSNWKGYPTIGIGAGYTIYDNVDVDLSWYRVVTDSNSLNNIDIFFAGLLVRFGGDYSGVS